MYCCHSIPECYNMFSGVKLSIRLFCFIYAYGNKFIIPLDFEVLDSTTSQGLETGYVMKSRSMIKIKSLYHQDHHQSQKPSIISWVVCSVCVIIWTGDSSGPKT